MATTYVDIRNTPPPPDWGVTVSQRAITALAERWADREFPLPSWDYKGLPTGLDDDNWYNMAVAGCSVLACIWPPEGDAMWSTHFEGEDLVDAPAVFSCFTRRIENGRLDLSMFGRLTAAEFFAGSGTLLLRDEKWDQLCDAAAAITSRWGGSVANLVADAEFDAERIADLLAATIPGFHDAPESPLGALPFFKLARLATAIMSAGGSTDFSGLGNLPLYPDYMLPRVLRDYGIMVYAEELAAAVDTRALIEKESPWELAIRWATVYSGDRLTDALRERGADVIPPALDYALWESAVLGPEADSLGEHHRTLTLAY